MSAPAFTRQGDTHLRPDPKPGKLTSLQRDYIKAASNFTDRGDPIPFADIHVPYQGRASLNGLLDRKLLEERGRGFYYLTENGWKVARAIYALCDDKHGQWRISEIEAHLAKARGESPSTHQDRDNVK